jgi:hypothetical protein
MWKMHVASARKYHVMVRTAVWMRHPARSLAPIIQENLKISVPVNITSRQVYVILSDVLIAKVFQIV